MEREPAVQLDPGVGQILLQTIAAARLDVEQNAVGTQRLSDTLEHLQRLGHVVNRVVDKHEVE